ncbi:MAG: hypothetical protein RH917_03905 [Lacipirellulaceae bacterium]
MAKVTLPAGYNTPETEAPVEIELKSPGTAALLAWLVPGLGHVYQGRTGKGILFFVCVMGTFLYGMALGEAKVVYAASTSPLPIPGPFYERWQYALQVGVGLAAMPAYVQTWRDPTGNSQANGEEGGFMAPPRQRRFRYIDDSGNETFQPNEQSLWEVKMHPNYEMGTVYTVIAGLLNLLVICDAYAGPLVILPPAKKEDDTDSEPDSESTDP